MTYKQIEASREARLWIGQVIVPAAVAGVTLMVNPEARALIKQKASDVKSKVTNKFKKKDHFAVVK